MLKPGQGRGGQRCKFQGFKRRSLGRAGGGWDLWEKEDIRLLMHILQYYYTNYTILFAKKF